MKAVKALRRRRKSTTEEDPHSNRPDDTDIKQQRLRAWNPVMTAGAYILAFLVIGIVFIVISVAIMASAAGAVVQREQYDGSGTPDSNKACHIAVADEARNCTVRIKLNEKMEGPLNVYYELDNFYQNHRRYVKSMSWRQLQEGKVLRKAHVSKDCYPLVENGSRVLHPCGVVANTLFNDVITLASPAGLQLKEDDIAWESDVRELYRQPQGFEWSKVAPPLAANCTLDEKKACPEAVCATAGMGPPCFHYICRGGYFDSYKAVSGGVKNCDAGQDVIFHYARPTNYQYLYETFPQVISPIVGVRNEHFAVWMRIAALPQFRKLYGRITKTLKKDTELLFHVENNFDVGAINGKKYIVIATKHGFETNFLATAYLVVGVICCALALAFAVLQCAKPRHLGDPRYIPWLQ